MSRDRTRRLTRWLLQAVVVLVIVFLYLVAFSRGQIVHGRIL